MVTGTVLEKIKEIEEQDKKDVMLTKKRTGKKYRELKRIVENISEGVLITDKDDRITFINKRITKIDKKSKSQLLGSNILKDFNELNLKFLKPYYLEAKRNLEVVSVKDALIKNHHNKNEKLMACKFIPFRKRKNFNGMICIIDDITYFNECDKQKTIAQNYLDIAEVIIVILNKKGKVTLINKKGRQLLGYKKKEILGKNWFNNFIPKNTSKDMRAKFRKFIKGEFNFPESYENPVITKDGEKKIISWRNSCIRDTEDQVIAVISSGEDITEKKLMEQRLIEDEKRFSLLAENANDVIFRYRIKPERKFEYISPSVERLTGYTQQENYKDPNMIFKLTYEKDRSVMTEIIESKKNIRKPIEIRWISKSGTTIWTEQNIVPIRSNNGIIAIDVIARDISERKKAEEKIRYLSFHDSLTDLFNRAYFEEELKRLNTPRQLPLSFIMGDVNSLKLVNDTFGHKEGDELLKSVATLMKSFCRSEDIIARWGGDEFAILLPQTPKDYAEDIIERIREACKKTRRKKIPISISLGLAIKVDKDQDINSIISIAEDNMYTRKLLEKKGLSASIISSITSNLFEKDPEMEKHIARIRTLALEVGKALKLEQGKLDIISLLATLHDIGKIAIPDELLNKTVELTERDWDIIKRHPEIGCSICESFPQLVQVSNAVLTHHENYDGSGYPQGIRGEEIPVEARIIAVVDTYDIMTHNCGYKTKLAKKDAVKEIRKQMGAQFDPNITKKFIRILNRH
jgi:diguanylate cyclase (GGDEF)-like protein/PAS domain S-box-containing protein